MSPQIKYGGKIVVCQPGTKEVVKSNEKGIVSNNKIRNARNGKYGLVIISLSCRAAKCLMLHERLQATFCIDEVRGICCWSCPVAMLKRNMIIKLPKSYLERVQPQTTAAMLQMLKFDCPAPYFANALLAEVLFRRLKVTH